MHDEVLGGSTKRKELRTRPSDMPRVRSAGTERGSPRQLEEHLLLECVSGEEAGEGQGGEARSMAVDELCGMHGSVSIQSCAQTAPGEGGERAYTVLREDMRGSRALSENERRSEPRLLTRPKPCPEAGAFSTSLSGGQSRDKGAGSAGLRSVQPGGEGTRSSHQPSPTGQPLGEPDLRMPQMPLPAARGREVELQRSADKVRAVDEYPISAGGVEVYDLQVEADHNFFANGVCVHNCLIIDDVIKSNEEARSKSYRDRAWDWFTKVAMTRRMGPKLVIITFTRWHEDDIIGRLTDPENEHYSRNLAKKIKIIDLPAIAGPDDPLGRKEGEPLWPERYDLDFLEEQQALDPLGFEALYQQRPSVADGVLFRREHIRYYQPEDLPDGLRIYCASDHAVTTNQRSDSTVLLKVGVDKQNNIYLLDCWWRKARTIEVVEAMLEMVRTGEAPLVWWAERGHISQSIGPFLNKRMAETETFVNVTEVTPTKDKEQRAQSIAARMAMGYVHFPKDKPWVGPAVEQLMAFPNGKHDDFVDTLAYIGLGLRNMVPGSPRNALNKEPRFGTLNWVKDAQRQEAMRLNLASTGGF